MPYKLSEEAYDLIMDELKVAEKLLTDRIAENNRIEGIPVKQATHAHMLYRSHITSAMYTLRDSVKKAK